MKAHLIDTHLLVPRSRSSAKVKVKYQDHVSQKMGVSGTLVFHKHILFPLAFSPLPTSFLNSSLKDFKTQNSVIKHAVIYLLMIFLKLAKYFCAETKEESEYFHYALNVPLYTHFTSPIRRYPDILVHRLLGAVLSKMIIMQLFTRWL